MLGAFFFCLVVNRVYARLGAILGPDGTLYAYYDDVYLVSDPVNMFITQVVAPAIYKIVGLRIGWGPGKTELILPPRCDPYAFLQQLDGACWLRPRGPGLGGHGLLAEDSRCPPPPRGWRWKLP